MVRRPQPLDFTKFPRRVLWFFGFYFSDDMQKHMFHRAVCVAWLALITPFPLMILLKLLVENQDFLSLLETLHYLFLHFWIVVKVFLFLKRLPRLRRLESWIQSEIFNFHDQQQDRIVSEALRKQIGFFKLLWSSTMSFATIFAAFLPSDKVSLNIPIWTPIKLNRMIWHVYEVLCYIVTASAYPAIDCVITGFIANMTAQLQILRCNLEKATFRNSGDDYAFTERKIHQRLRHCIIHHNAILEYINETEHTFSLSLFCQILFSVLGICLSGFQFLLVEPGSEKFILASVYLIIMLFQIYFICWFVEDMVMEGFGIISSCYTSEWYTCTTSTKKLFFIIMQRAAKPITFRAGYFFLLCLYTFVNILRNSYSYFAILRQVYRD